MKKILIYDVFFYPENPKLYIADTWLWRTFFWGTTGVHYRQVWLYNHFHNNLTLFEVLPNFLFTTSKTMRDYYLWTWRTHLLNVLSRNPDPISDQYSPFIAPWKQRSHGAVRGNPHEGPYPSLKHAPQPTLCHSHPISRTPATITPATKPHEHTIEMIFGNLL